MSPEPIPDSPEARLAAIQSQLDALDDAIRRSTIQRRPERRPMTRRSLWTVFVTAAPLISMLASVLLIVVVATGFGWHTPAQKFQFQEHVNAQIFDSISTQRSALARLEARQAEDRSAMQLLLRIGCRPLRERDLIQQCDNVGAR